MAVRRYHAHALRSQLPEHPVQDWPTFLGTRREGDVGNELVQILGRCLPSAREIHSWKGRKLFAGKPEELESRESRAATLNGDTLFTGACKPNGGTRKLADDLNQFAGRERNGSLLLNGCGHTC
jgi:hypothetical protein